MWYTLLIVKESGVVGITLLIVKEYVLVSITLCSMISLCYNLTM